MSKQELITAAGGQEGASIKIISCKKCTEGNYGYKALQLDSQERKPYWRIRRVRYMDMVPYAYEDIYMNTDFLKQSTPPSIIWYSADCEDENGG